MFPRLPAREHLLRTQNLCPGHKKCVWFCSETFCVRNKCFPVYASQETSMATMCPQQCVLVYQGLYGDTAAILNSIVSKSYYGMLRGRIRVYLLPEHPIIATWNNRIQNGCSSPKRSNTKRSLLTSLFTFCLIGIRLCTEKASSDWLKTVRARETLVHAEMFSPFGVILNEILDFKNCKISV